MAIVSDQQVPRSSELPTQKTVITFLTAAATRDQEDEAEATRIVPTLLLEMSPPASTQRMLVTWVDRDLLCGECESLLADPCILLHHASKVGCNHRVLLIPDPGSEVKGKFRRTLRTAPEQSRLFQACPCAERSQKCKDRWDPFAFLSVISRTCPFSLQHCSTLSESPSSACSLGTMLRWWQPCTGSSSCA